MGTPSTQLRPLLERDSYRRHQLQFEAVGILVLLILTRSPAKVLVPGLVLLPATRSTWLGWVRAGIGIPLTAAVCTACAVIGGGTAAAVVFALAVATGAARTVQRRVRTTGRAGSGSQDGLRRP